MRLGPKACLGLLIAAFLLAPAAQAVVETGGVATGVWTSDQGPYIITQDVMVPEGASLAIEAGVEILFDQNTSMVVRGSLAVHGSPKNLVVFAPMNDEVVWSGVQFVGNDTDQGVIDHAVFYACNAGLQFQQATYSISNTEIDGINGAIRVVGNSDVTLDHVTASVHTQQGSSRILDGNRSTIHVAHSTFQYVLKDVIAEENVNAIRFFRVSGSFDSSHVAVISSSTAFGMNLIACGGDMDVERTSIRMVSLADASQSRSAAIRVAASTVVLNNLSLDLNSSEGILSGIYATDFAHVSIDNSIIANPSGLNIPGNSPIFIEPLANPATVDVAYSLFYNLDVDATEGLEFGDGLQLNDNPRWMNPAQAEYHLLPDSPCINAGDPNSPLDPDGTRADMGRFSYFITLSDVGPSPVASPRDFQLTHAYPNPFNATTRFTVELPKDAPLYVAVYDVLGRQVDVLANGEYNAGRHAFTWNAHSQAGEAASGVYLIMARSGNHTQRERIVLVR